jgi:hypothetical protein
VPAIADRAGGRRAVHERYAVVARDDQVFGEHVDAVNALIAVGQAVVAGDDDALAEYACVRVAVDSDVDGFVTVVLKERVVRDHHFASGGCDVDTRQDEVVDKAVSDGDPLHSGGGAVDPRAGPAGGGVVVAGRVGVHPEEADRLNGDVGALDHQQIGLRDVRARAAGGRNLDRAGVPRAIDS